jgi:hypothetical protein
MSVMHKRALGAIMRGLGPRLHASNSVTKEDYYAALNSNLRLA